MAISDRQLAEPAAVAAGAVDVDTWEGEGGFVPPEPEPSREPKDVRKPIGDTRLVSVLVVKRTIRRGKGVTRSTMCRRSMLGYRTTSPHLAVTSTMEDGGQTWTLTHIPTGGRLIRVNDVRVGQIVAAVLAMFIPFEEMTFENAEAMQDRLPRDIKAWMRSVRA